MNVSDIRIGTIMALRFGLDFAAKFNKWQRTCRIGSRDENVLLLVANNSQIIEGEVEDNIFYLCVVNNRIDQNSGDNSRILTVDVVVPVNFTDGTFRQVNHPGGGKQWQSMMRITDPELLQTFDCRRDEYEIVFVVDRESKIVPKSDNTRWKFDLLRPISVGPFKAIFAVNPTEEIVSQRTLNRRNGIPSTHTSKSAA